MVVWKTKASDTSPTTPQEYGGQTIDAIIDYFSDVDLSSEGTDSSGVSNISTFTFFRTNAFNLWDSNKSHYIRVQTPDYTSNKTLTFPSQSAIQSSDEFLLKDSVQIVKNKVLDYNLNTFVNLPSTHGIAVAGGEATLEGDASTSIFTIAHTLETQPDTYYVLPTSADARGNYILSADGTNITITYPVPPPDGTNNLTFVWAAGYIHQALGFTPTSSTTLTNKIIGDFITFLKQGSTPDDPADNDDSLIYIREIDANNNGLFVKIKKDGATMEVQIL